MGLFFTDSKQGIKVGVWQISEDQAELEMGMTYRSEASNAERRIQQLASRKILFSLAPELDSNRIEIEPSGKPIDRLKTIAFSISHTKGFAAAVVGTARSAGIDIELISERASRVAPRFLSLNEMSLITRTENAGIYGIHTLCWSIKETIYKWWGNPGLDFSKQIEIKKFTEQGVVEVVLKQDNKLVDCKVYARRFENLWLTYMVGMH